MHVAIDPLPTSMTDSIVTAAEAAAVAEESGFDSIRIALDVRFGSESPEGVLVTRRGQKRLSYIRIHLPDSEPDVIHRCAIAPLFTSLKQIGFVGRVCLLLPNGRPLAPSPDFCVWMRKEWIRA